MPILQYDLSHVTEHTVRHCLQQCAQYLLSGYQAYREGWLKKRPLIVQDEGKTLNVAYLILAWGTNYTLFCKPRPLLYSNSPSVSRCWRTDFYKLVLNSNPALIWQSLRLPWSIPVAVYLNKDKSFNWNTTDLNAMTKLLEWKLSLLAKI